MSKNKNEVTIRSSAAEYLTYSVEVRYEDENIWLTQKILATVYDVNLATINEHIKNIYKDNELEENRTIRKFRIVQKEGNRNVSREVAHYNLQIFTKKLLIFMQLQSIMIKQPQQLFDFLRLFKTNFIMQYLEILPQKLFIIEQTIWD